MCEFIAATLPSQEARARLAPLIEQYGLSFSPLFARPLLAQFCAGEYYPRATHGHCDCGTDLAAGRGRHRAAKAGRLKRKGWGEAKIKRWLDEQAGADDRRAARARHQQEPATPSLEAWVAFLHDALADGLTKNVGLIVHSGHDHEFKPVGVERVSINDVDEDFLDSMKENVLYRFEASV
jgi:hypothetical protein